MKISAAVFAAACSLSAPSARAAGGVTFITEQTDAQGTTRTSTVRLDADHIRMEGGAHGDPSRGVTPDVVIFDGVSRKMYALDSSRKTYLVMDPAKMGDMRSESDARMGQARAQMEEKMKTMSPEQRAQIEAMMARRGGGMGGPGAPGAAGAPGAPGAMAHAGPHVPKNLAFTATGLKRTVNGFSCEIYNVTDEGQPYETDCIASWGSSTITREDMAVFKKMAETFSSMMGGAGAASVQMNQQLTKYPGFPIVRTRLNPDGSKRGEDTVKSIKHGVDAGVFKVPADYQQAVMQGPHGRGAP